MFQIMLWNVYMWTSIEWITTSWGYTCKIDSINGLLTKHRVDWYAHNASGYSITASWRDTQDAAFTDPFQADAHEPNTKIWPDNIHHAPLGSLYRRRCRWYVSAYRVPIWWQEVCGKHQAPGNEKACDLEISSSSAEMFQHTSRYPLEANLHSHSGERTVEYVWGGNRGSSSHEPRQHWTIRV